MIEMTQTNPKDDLFGTVKVGERGQIVIPKDARDQYNIKPGDTLLIVGRGNKGLVIVKPERLRELAHRILEDLEGID